MSLHTMNEESVETSLIQLYFNEWGLSEDTCKKFIENEITLQYLPKIKDFELKELIPGIKERILFKSGLEQLEKITHDTASETTISGPSSPASSIESSTSTSYAVEEQDGKKLYNIDIPAILNDNSYGKLVLARVESNKKLDATSRSYLVKSIVEWYLKQYQCMKKEDFIALSEAITLFIPTEHKETYYIPALLTKNKQIPARGKLVDRYNNQRRLLKKEGVITKKRKLNDTETEGSEKDDIIEHEDFVTWLKYNKEPYQEIREKWLATRPFRIAKDYASKENKLQDILKKYPILKQNIGYKLIDIDFEYMHPGKELVLYEKFDSFMQKAFEIFKTDVKVFKDYKEIYEKSSNEDTKVFAILSLLCGKLVPAVGRRSSLSKGFSKPTILEARDSLLLHVKTQTDVITSLEKRRAIHLEKKMTCQPIVVCVGSTIENLEAFYVNFDDVTYHVETLLQAVDICFKIFQVFDVEYPKECLQQWIFIQHYFYEIQIPQDRKLPNVATLIAELM